MVFAYINRLGYDFNYDDNGNMIYDGHKGVNISYNLLNLPEKIVAGSDEVSYVYTAAGVKLAAKFGSSTTYYRGSFVYNNDELDHIIHPEGIIRKTSGAYVYYYAKTDHLGSTRILCHAANGKMMVDQGTDYYAFGLAHQLRATNTNRYLFSGKELQDQYLNGSKLMLYDFGARNYDPIIGRWFNVDPALQFTNLYIYCANNPVNLIDPDGRWTSTHLNEKGRVVAVFNDGDNGVYQHSRNADGSSVTEFQLLKRTENKGTSSGGTKVGETAHWDEFVSPETGRAMTKTTIQLGKSFDPIISEMHGKAREMNLMEIASESAGGGLFDIKKDYNNVGALLDGKYATSRSAGNFLAGYNAESGTYLGIGISFTTFQKLAGALHIEESNGKRLSKGQMLNIVTLGTYTSSDKSKFVAPTWGEVMYQYRMSKAGWDYRK